jgi:hypothetical protein
MNPEDLQTKIENDPRSSYVPAKPSYMQTLGKYGRNIGFATAITAATLTPNYAHAGFFDVVRDLIFGIPKMALQETVRLLAEAPYLFSKTVITQSTEFYKVVEKMDVNNNGIPDLVESKKSWDEMIKTIKNLRQVRLAERVKRIETVANSAKARLANPNAPFVFPYGTYVTPNAQPPRSGNRGNRGSR